MATNRRPALVTNFRKNVRLAMRRKRMIQTDLAKLLDVDRSTISHVLRGDFDPGLGVVEKWAKALRVDPLELLRKSA